MQISKQTYVIIKRIQNNKGVLASLRHAHSMNDHSAQAVWPYMFKAMDKEELSVNGVPTPAENAIFTALKCYAIMKQGSTSVEYDSKKAHNLFTALNVVTYASDDGQGIGRRVVQLFSSRNIDYMLGQIVHLTQIVKSNGYKASLDYPHLAEDLYNLQQDAMTMRQTVIKWGQEYSQMPQTEENKGE